MDNQLLTMMSQIMEQMTQLQTDVSALQVDTSSLRAEMNTRFDTVDSKLDTLDVQLNSGLKQTGEQFAKVDASVERLSVTFSKEVGYLNHKVTTVDKELYFRTPKY